MTTVSSASSLGRAIREAREQRGLTQGALASNAGVGRQWLVGLELGDKGSPPLDMLLRLLAALDMSITLSPPRPTPPAPPSVDLDEIIARHQDRSM